MVYYQRNLPHWQPQGKRIFLTWRLYGSLAAVFLSNLHKNTSLEPRKKFLSLDGRLDCADFGPVWLKETQIAQAVVNAIGSVANEGWCIVFAYVVMPNHVHLLLEPKTELRLVTRAIKGPTARVCNEFLNRTGQPFWQQESYDHWVRNPSSFERIRRYIENNPVSAGLVKSPERWEWSSAHR
jgi:REP-associated tyrosine transposase